MAEAYFGQALTRDAWSPKIKEKILLASLALVSFMNETIGAFVDLDPDSFLILMSLKLFPGLFPIEWKQCGATANFLANYFGSFYVAHKGGSPEKKTGDNEIAVMSYILNELVENAVKFNEGGSIQVQVGLLENELIFVVENHISRSTTISLRPKLTELVSQDAAELFLRRLEENAENPNVGSSGLGFITMMNDYHARLGWRLSPAPGGEDRLVLSTMVRVALEHHRTPEAARP